LGEIDSHCNSDTVIHTIHWKNGRSLILREKRKVDHQTWVAFYQRSRPRPIKAAKKMDLMDLLEFVPPIHHAFYQDLLSEGGTEDSEDESEHEHSESENSEQSDQDND
jgi:hypothetical protein